MDSAHATLEGEVVWEYVNCFDPRQCIALHAIALFKRETIMEKDDRTEGLNRRGFLAGATVAGLAHVPLSKTSRVEAQESRGLMGALPNSLDAAMEHDTPEGYTEAQAANYFVDHPGSDFMADVLKTLEFDYLALNPGSAFRGLHESLLNHGGNTSPEILTCVHEEHAAAIAHGYAKVAKRPMAIACHGTVGIVMDTHLQEADIHEQGLAIPQVVAPRRALGDPNAIEEAAQWLANAESPVIYADRFAQDQEGVDLLVELAQLLQAPVVDQKGRMNFPNTHHLSQTAGVVSQADVILALEVRDVWGIVNRIQDAPDHTLTRAARPDARVISLGTTEVNFGSNYQDFTRFYAADLPIAGDAQASVPYLIEALRERINGRRASQIAERRDRWESAHASRRQASIDAARYAWNATPIGTARMSLELYDLVKDKDWALTAPDNLHGSWESRLWDIERHYQTNGTSGAYGQGYGASSAVGAALGHREHGRLPICITGDGDTMYVPGVHWTAAHHRIPLLTVVHNNRAYHQEVMHVQKTAAWRQRGVDKGVEPGNIIDDPAIDFAASSMWASAAITVTATRGRAVRPHHPIRASHRRRILSKRSRFLFGRRPGSCRRTRRVP